MQNFCSWTSFVLCLTFFNCILYPFFWVFQCNFDDFVLMRWRFENFSITTESDWPSTPHLYTLWHNFVLVLSQIAIEFADRYNSALVCHRWRYLACHPRLWLRVDRSVKDSSELGVFPNIETAVSAARFVKLHLLIRHSWGR